MLQNMHKAKFKLSLLAALSLGVASNVSAHSLQSQILSFEGNGLPDNVHSNDARLTQQRVINGEQSLLWDWGKSHELTIEQDFVRMTDKQASKAYGRGATQVLSFWIYNPVAVNDIMQVMLTDADVEQTTTLPVNMNFTGWRAVGVSLNADFKPAVTHNLSKLIFKAPSTITQAAQPVFIDRVMVSVDDKRYQWSDHQVTTRYNLPEINFGLSKDIPSPTTAQLADIDVVQQQLIGQFKGRSGSFESLQKRFDDYQISIAADGTITGRHIVMGYQKTIYQTKHLSSEDKALVQAYRELDDYTDLMLDLAKAYHNSAFDGYKSDIVNMYSLLTKHLLDQGYAAGSGLVTTHHWGYSTRWWYISALMMANELEQQNLLKPTYEALLWFSREFKSSFDMALNEKSSNLDYFNTLSNQHLALLLLNPDVKERVALIKQFSHFFSGALSQTPSGYHDGFRPDGTAWRHYGHYAGYAFPAFKRAAQVAYILKGTEFALQNTALDSLKKVMVAGWRYTNPYVPLGLSGRHPFSKLGVKHYSSGLRDLAMAYPILDEELAAIYLQVTNQSADQGSQIFGQNIVPAKLPEGSWSYNGGAFVVHRHGDRMALIKGYNKDVWSSEIYRKDNRYGRYQSHGSVHVMPFGEPDEWGYQEAGWDWNRNPGATTIHLSLDELESPNKHSLMLRSDTGVSGSTSLQDKFSLFTFKHQAPQDKDKFESSFVAEKHVLAADNMLFLTGNGISNLDGKNVTETTLFQLAVADTPRSIWVNGEEINSTRFDLTLGTGDWLIDDNGVGYFLQNVEQVKVSRGSQTSRHNKTKQQTKGVFTKAWINHGTAPLNASYEYVVVMDATPSQMSELAQKMARYPYFNIRKTDQNGMYIRNRINNLYGYSSTDFTNFKFGPVRSVSTTAQLLVQLNAKQATLSVSSPELKVSKTQATQSVPIEIVLKGIWQTSDADYQHVKGNTLIKTHSFFGQAANIQLSKAE
ncbi:hypothetical protein J8M21_24785 [Pseudoalteromonas luteoviolacea]|uniref:chondroitinase family polysaccharide lyase n=1 Tax=Pseudoalteromonas luteoviolacea TaxID=43657 RepID=UPI001B3A1F43|nr:chondroitinase family polysaccharide lyase [Pseudoalteromonas luteoviolacea]MBQ4880420.1 hypothetical protein [Pseudoalteromonas luteoviolacea]MBQ4909481.1 hypothetical protein [Pseudoalteromonas luteoviolacea]